MTEKNHRITDNIKEHISVIEQMLTEQSNVLADISDAIVKSISAGGKILIAGNGGSAADAQHIAGEFIGRFLYDRNPLPAIALSTDTSVLTCVGNDYSYDDIFERQVRALGDANDIFWGISTSGNSPNIIKAARSAKQIGMTVIGFAGQNGGELKNIADLCFCSPHHRTNRIQEAHILAYHIVCELMESALCPKQ